MAAMYASLFIRARPPRPFEVLALTLGGVESSRSFKVTPESTNGRASDVSWEYSRRRY